MKSYFVVLFAFLLQECFKSESILFEVQFFSAIVFLRVAHECHISILDLFYDRLTEVIL